MEMVLTVVSGVLVFIFSQLFIEHYLTPIKKYKQLKSKISFILIYYANIYANPYIIAEYTNQNSDSYKIILDRYSTAQTETRRAAAEVSSFNEQLYFPRIGIPKSEILNEVSSHLIGVSNGCILTGCESNLVQNNMENQKRVKQLLKLKSR